MFAIRTVLPYYLPQSLLPAPGPLPPLHVLQPAQLQTHGRFPTLLLSQLVIMETLDHDLAIVVLFVVLGDGLQVEMGHVERGSAMNTMEALGG